MVARRLALFGRQHVCGLENMGREVTIPMAEGELGMQHPIISTFFA
jgi:hypothetical protein